MHGDARICLVSVEYLVEGGHVLHEISASVNGRAVSATACRLALARLVDLGDPACLAGRRICKIETYAPPGSASGETWFTYMVPIPHEVIASDDTLLVNTLLETRDAATGAQLFSSINFQTPNSPRPVCTAVAVVDFNPTLFAKVVLYESVALRARELSNSTHTMQNLTVDGVVALTMANSLPTLVLALGDAPGALAYFEANPDEAVCLDEVYMLHAKPDVAFGPVRNGLTPTGAGRLAIALDAGLLQRYPLESGAGFTYGPGEFQYLQGANYFSLNVCGVRIIPSFFL